MKRIPIILFVVFLVVAFFDSVYLTYHHHMINILVPETPSFCSINSLINCDSVAMSDYSTLFSIPISTLGIFAYTFLLAFFIVGYFRQKTRLSRVYREHLMVMFPVLMLMVGFSLYEFFVSVFIIKALCIMCVLLYISVITMCITLKLAMRATVKDSFKGFVKFYFPVFKLNRTGSNIFISVIILALSIFVAYIFDLYFQDHFIMKANERTLTDRAVIEKEEQESLYDSYKKLETISFDLSDTPMEGTKDAPITMVEFSDFECPFCAVRAGTIKEIIKKFPGKIQFYYKHSPLDKSCNPEVQRQMHPSACLAAYYGHCAFKQGKFWEMHDAIFGGDRENLGSELLKSYVKKLNLDEAKMQTCMQTVAKAKVAKDLSDAKKGNVDGTPTIFINGKKVSEIAKKEGDFDFLINKILNEEAGKK